MTCDKSTISCKLKPTNPRFKDRTGLIYGRLTVLGYAGKHCGRVSWWCECICGTTKLVGGRHLNTGKIQSCGCLRKEASVQRSTTHGACGTPEFAAFRRAKGRCTNPNLREFPNYGGRGIEFRFTSFDEFFAEVGQRPTPEHSIDRKDVNGHYEPGNVRWATVKTQANNKRRNHFLEINGERKTMAQWGDVMGISGDTIFARLKKGWCDACAVMSPLRGHCIHR